MKVSSIAVRAVFIIETGNAYTRAMDWFKEHPSEPYCYWGKNQLFGISDKDNKQLLKDNGIEDIESHTRVYKDNDLIILKHFCNKYRDYIKDLVEDNIAEGTDHNNTVKWRVEPDPENDNYILKIKKA